MQAGGGTQLVPELARDSLWEGSREDPVSWDPVDRDGFRSRLAQFLLGGAGGGDKALRRANREQVALGSSIPAASCSPRVKWGAVLLSCGFLKY